MMGRLTRRLGYLSKNRRGENPQAMESKLRLASCFFHIASSRVFTTIRLLTLYICHTSYESVGPLAV
ncbi:hypothetical protein EYC84_000185 [Monilinia fructicola]|uniref:Uncharacterized protein n=1 Tax=Monilinia fructicola TaxID=38448 RepID=A0A5M9JQV2_MONFR|nr:hypothetical protein EYC84_000185 [Monilinia fructicola]